MKQRLFIVMRRLLLGVTIVSLLVTDPLIAQQTPTSPNNNDTPVPDWKNLESIFSSQTIRWYRPGDTASCTATSSTSSGPVKKVVDYKNREILNDDQIKLIEEFKPVYAEAASKAGIPWEMIAVVHYRETRFAKTNPTNGQGIYQDFAGRGKYPPGPISDEDFKKQTEWVANFLREKAGSKAEGLKKAEDDAVKYTFFAYNGLAGVYKEQAKKLGFSQEQAENGEGSPYVMNKADEKRDPTTNPSSWGQIKSDGGSIQYPANQDHGSFVIYAALRGNIAGCGDSSLDQGGLTKEQAVRFVKAYGADKNGFSSSITGPLWGMCNGGGSNCVTFSYFFNKAFTNLPVSPGDGNGNKIVSSLGAKGAKTGSEPKLFSTFSWDNDSFGHTGIVLGIHGDEYIVGHASCSSEGIGAGDGHTYGKGGGAAIIEVGKKDDPNVWFGKVPTEFAYPDQVDTSKIQKFLND